MNTKIDIHENKTALSGTYKVWYKNLANILHCRTLSESYINCLLSFEQKEKFFNGQYKFKINEYDFKTIVLNGEKRQGIN